VCVRCGAGLAVPVPVPRDAECPECGLDVRCCLQCRHHAPAFHNQCRESEADPVADKDRRNFCEFFELAPAGARAAAAGAAGTSREAAARAKLDALFGARPAATDRAGDARSKLESLFRRRPPEEADED
jgi:hypothetical protein